MEFKRIKEIQSDYRLTIDLKLDVMRWLFGEEDYLDVDEGPVIYYYSFQFGTTLITFKYDPIKNNTLVYANVNAYYLTTSIKMILTKHFHDLKEEYLESIVDMEINSVS